MHQRLLGNGADRLADMPVLVLRGKLRRLSCTHHRVELDRHARAFARFIRRAGSGKQLAVVLRLLPGAEHALPGLSLVIALCKALAGEDRLQLLHVVFRDAPAVDRGAVCLCDHCDILRALHSALDFDRRNAHALEFAHMLNEAIVFQAQRIPRRLESAVAIRKPARLGALPAVSRAPADDAG